MITWATTCGKNYLLVIFANNSAVLQNFVNETLLAYRLYFSAEFHLVNTIFYQIRYMWFQMYRCKPRDFNVSESSMQQNNRMELLAFSLKETDRRWYSVQLQSDHTLMSVVITDVHTFLQEELIVDCGSPVVSCGVLRLPDEPAFSRRSTATFLAQSFSE